MYHIVMVNKHSGERDYLINLAGKPATWENKEKAEEQIKFLMAGYSINGPKNFTYKIEYVENTP